MTNLFLIVLMLAALIALQYSCTRRMRETLGRNRRPVQLLLSLILLVSAAGFVYSQRALDLVADLAQRNKIQLKIAQLQEAQGFTVAQHISRSWPGRKIIVVGNSDSDRNDPFQNGLRSAGVQALELIKLQAAEWVDSPDGLILPDKSMAQEIDAKIPPPWDRLVVILRLQRADKNTLTSLELLNAPVSVRPAVVLFWSRQPIKLLHRMLLDRQIDALVVPVFGDSSTETLPGSPLELFNHYYALITLDNINYYSGLFTLE